MYLPMIGARSFRVCSGISSGRVISAFWSAVAHSQARAVGTRPTAVREAAWAVFAFCVRFAMI